MSSDSTVTELTVRFKQRCTDCCAVYVVDSAIQAEVY